MTVILVNYLFYALLERLFPREDIDVAEGQYNSNEKRLTFRL